MIITTGRLVSFVGSESCRHDLAVIWPKNQSIFLLGMGQTYSTLGVGKYCKATQRAVFCQLVLKQFLGEGQNISGSSLQGLLRSISWNPFIVVGFSKDHRSKQSLPIISAWNHPQNWSGMMWLSDLQLQTNGKTTHMINNHLYCTFTIFYHPFCHLEELTKFVHPPRFSHDLVGKATFNPQTDCGNEEICAFRCAPVSPQS